MFFLFLDPVLYANKVFQETIFFRQKNIIRTFLKGAVVQQKENIVPLLKWFFQTTNIILVNVTISQFTMS